MPLSSINQLQAAQNAYHSHIAFIGHRYLVYQDKLCAFFITNFHKARRIGKHPLIKMSNSADEPPWKPAVDAVRKYYNFLIEELEALPADCVEYPPQEGWPNISEESLAGLQKTKQVVDVLRHLPYIKYSNEFNVQIAFGTEALDYRGVKIAVGERKRWVPHGDPEFPPHVVVLTSDRSAGSYGSQVLLDTEKSECYSSTLVPV